MALLNYRIDYHKVCKVTNLICSRMESVPYAYKYEYVFRYYGKKFLDWLDIDIINPLEWAEHMGLEIINENGPKIICYKSVHATYPLNPEAIPEFYSDFEGAPKVIYYVGKNAYPDNFNPNPLMVCTSGLHASTLDYAKKYGCVWDNLAILELMVDPEKCVVPYDAEFKASFHALELTPANKFRFSECFVRKAMIKQ